MSSDRRPRRRALRSALAALVLGSLSPAFDAAALAQEPLTVEAWLAVPPVDERGRRPFREDAVFGRHLLQPGSAPPIEGEPVVGARDEARWEAHAPAKGGVAGGGRIAWASGELVVPEGAGGAYLARLAGAFELWVDGMPVAGDGYRYGLVGSPVWLAEGRHRVFVSGVRGAFELAFERAPASPLPLVAEPRDAALPDVGSDDAGRPLLVGLPLHSTSTEWLGRTRISVRDGGDFEPGPAGDVSGFAPLGTRRAALSVTPRASESAPRRWKLPLAIEVEGQRDALLVELALEHREPHQPRLRTYRSSVDGAVLPYGLLAPTEPAGRERHGLVLSLHGASVNPRAQIQSYSSKRSHWIAAPTNRRPFGFDWQDWGRRDAFDVVRELERRLDLDPARRAVTGHSMGGHGTWHLAAWDAGAFAAAAPSAGWQSFDTYGGPRPAGELRELWHAADRGSETARAASALARLPWYVLHGDADDVVPADEARGMLALLAEHGAKRVRSHFESGAGHWWDGDRAAGADCVDWPELFETLTSERRDLVAELVAWPPVGTRVALARTCLERPDGHAPDRRWLDVLEPLTPGTVAHFTGELTHTAGFLRVELWTQGVGALEYRPPDGANAPARVELELDDQLFHLEGAECAARWTFRRGTGGVWQRVVGADVGVRQAPGASGPFKRVFDRLPVLVVGTIGTAEETAELLAAARFDAARWNVRAAGDLELARDVDVIESERAERFAGRNLVLYGNRDTNAAFDALVPRGAPFDARRGAVALLDARGTRTVWRGTSLAAFAVRPRTDAHAGTALLGFVASTGTAGARLSHLSAWMVSGVGLPDLALYDATVLTRGDAGVLAALWWREDWGAPDTRRP